MTNLRHRIREYLARRLRVPQISFALERLHHQGFTPRLIFDVGAYRGDFARDCKRVWLESKIVCFEPQRGILPELHRFATQASEVSIVESLIGPENREKVVLHEAETASSVLTETAGVKYPTTEYTMRTLDSVIENEAKGEVPALLKLDVQGYELHVLKGVASYLSRIEVILAEINLIDLHNGVPLLDETVAWLADHGWVAFDICGLTRRPLDDALWQTDIIFVPLHSPLRNDKRWQA